MPYILQASFWVGVIGTVAAVPLLCLLRFQPSYLSKPIFQWSAPAVLFFIAALTYMAAYGLLPSSQWRTRLAGSLAGIITFFGFAIWVSFMAGVGLGPFDRSQGVVYSFAFVFVIVGWIPLGGGWFAGWVVSKLPDAPADETA